MKTKMGKDKTIIAENLKKSKKIPNKIIMQFYLWGLP
jgi:hypothetical protein